MSLKFIPIPNYNLKAATTGEGKGRLLIFRSDEDNGIWERVEGAQILIVGSKTERELLRFVQENGRPAANKVIPGGIAGRAYPALRKHFNLTT